MNIHENHFADIDMKIRAGQIQAARSLLGEIDPKSLPRDLRLQAANLCRRTDLVQRGLKILAPLVQFEKGRWRADAGAKELAEYAVLMQKSGAVFEAAAILRQIDPAQLPEALLYRAYCHMHLWEYDQAVAALAEYENVEQRPYPQLVGRVNRAAALIVLEKTSEALVTVNEVLDKAAQQQCVRLQANALELRAQVHIQRNAFQEARADLRAAAELIAANPAADYFYIKMWTAIIAGLEAKCTNAIAAVRAEALSRRQFESVRTLDLFALKIKFDEQLFEHLYFGSPYLLIRGRLLRDHGMRAVAREYFHGQSGGPALDLKSGKLQGPVGSKDATRKTHALLAALVRDFYRPSTPGSLFAEIFPGEFFNHETSVHRVHQAIYRARGWLEDNRLPVKIREHDGYYRLNVTGPFAFIMSADCGVVQTEALRLNRLAGHFGHRSFSAAEACAVLGVAHTSVKKLMKWARENGKIQRSGAGPTTIYKFAA